MPIHRLLEKPTRRGHASRTSPAIPTASSTASPGGRKGKPCLELHPLGGGAALHPRHLPHRGLPGDPGRPAQPVRRHQRGPRAAQEWRLRDHRPGARRHGHRGAQLRAVPRLRPAGHLPPQGERARRTCRGRRPTRSSRTTWRGSRGTPTSRGTCRYRRPSRRLTRRGRDERTRGRANGPPPRVTPCQSHPIANSCVQQVSAIDRGSWRAQVVSGGAPIGILQNIRDFHCTARGLCPPLRQPRATSGTKSRSSAPM